MYFKDRNKHFNSLTVDISLRTRGNVFFSVNWQRNPRGLAHMKQA